MTARDAALKALMKISEHGAYVNLTVKSIAPELSDKRERAFFTALVYGVTEKRTALRMTLQKISKPEKLPPQVREIVYMGAYQIIFMDQIPDSAAVSECVRLAGKHGFKGLSGVVNGVLRKLARDRSIAEPPRDKKSRAMYQFNFSDDIADMWLEYIGDGFDRAIEYDENRKRSGISLRVRRVEYMEEIKREIADIGGECCDLPVPDCVICEGVGDIASMDLFKNGLAVPESPSSVLIARALGALPSMKVLDTCAAPGGKTCNIADIMGDTGSITALDIHEHRVELIRGMTRRLGISSIDARVMDATDLPREFDSAFDRVLVDAPCSGLSSEGKPETALRTTKKDVLALAELQKSILDSAANTVKPGGALVYSTCTWTQEENICQVKAFLERHSDFAAGDLEGFLPEKFADRVTDGFSLQLDASIDGIPSFFISRFIRSKEDR